MADAINTSVGSKPQYTPPVQKAAPPPVPTPAREAAASGVKPDGLSSSKESRGENTPDRAQGTVADFAKGFGSAVAKGLAATSSGEAFHDASAKLQKKARAAEKNREGVPEVDMKRLKDAAHGGVFKKAAAAAMLGTDIKGLPDAVKQAEQWNQMPQWQRDAAATGLGAAAKATGFVEGIIHPHKQQ